MFRARLFSSFLAGFMLVGYLTSSHWLDRAIPSPDSGKIILFGNLAAAVALCIMLLLLWGFEQVDGREKALWLIGSVLAYTAGFVMFLFIR